MSLNIVVFICFVVYLVRLSHRLLRTAVFDRFTAINDLPLLGISRSSSDKLAGQAVIAGGSIAGLLAARICSDHFESVLVVEPEKNVQNYDYAHFIAEAKSNSELAKRARVSQYNAAHGYQVLTLRALKKLFPRFEDDLRTWGGRILPADMRVHVSGRLISPSAELTSANETMFASRHLYESLLRALVARTCPNVKLTHGSVVGILPSSGSASAPDPYLSNVIIRTDENESAHDAAFLIGDQDLPSVCTHGTDPLFSLDCTGLAQAGLTWLEKAGYGKFTNLRISYDPRFRGTTCHFRVPEVKNERLGAIYLYIPDPRCDVRNFYIQRVERDWMQIVCAGYGILDRLTSFEDITTFFSRITPSVPLPQNIRTLPTTLFNTGARDKGWQYFRLSDVSLVRYDLAAASALPANFAAFGDAVCRMNPIHGQGATLAVVGAITLNAALTMAPKSLPRDFSSNFMKRLVARIVGTWEVNKCNDYGFSTTERSLGDSPWYGAFHRWYGAHLVEVASRDVDVAASMWHVQNFLAPGTDLFAPSIICKVLWNCAKAAVRALS